MQLANADAAIVSRSKIGNYLLDLAHPIGGGKARFFLSFGFRREEWNLLADAFRKHAQENPVANSISDADGVTYLIEGPLETPSGRKGRACEQSGFETGQVAPRFITSYPLAA